VDTTVVLDKWGLPPPTLNDIFPSLPEGTELVPVGSRANHTLEQMQHALRHVVPLTLDRHFDEFGVERDSAAGWSSRNEGDHDSGRQRKAMKLRLLHQSPPVLAIENFFTPEECEATRRVVEAPSKPSAAAGGGPSPPVQVGSRTFEGAISRRTSTSWFCCYEQHPALLAKAVHVLGLQLPNMEEPQVVRYQPGQEFSFHYDQVPAHQTGNGGQRLATLL
jgi:prolyl 4-hydroxylase